MLSVLLAIGLGVWLGYTHRVLINTKIEEWLDKLDETTNDDSTNK